MSKCIRDPDSKIQFNKDKASCAEGERKLPQKPNPHITHNFQYVPMQKKLIFAFLFILLFPALILILSGDYTWPEGWVFNIWFLLLCYSTILYLYKKDPALLAERYKQPGASNQEGWDVYVIYGIMIGFIVWILIMPLDAKRFGWSPVFPLWLTALGIAFLIGSFFLFFRSYTDNTFLSPLVRIQEERKQRVVSTGVYGFVRHPMYLGGILMFLGAPLLLGSLYGILAGLALTGIFSWQG